MTPETPYLLVVEDEAAQRQILTEYLSRQGLRLAAVPNGTLMREAIQAELPQLVLLDVGLPGEDGFVLARTPLSRLRESHGARPVVLGEQVAGLALHDAYHAGQVALVLRLADSRPR